MERPLEGVRGKWKEGREKNSGQGRESLAKAFWKSVDPGKRVTGLYTLIKTTGTMNKLGWGIWGSPKSGVA